MRDILTSPRILEIKHKRRIQKIRASVIYLLFIITIVGAVSYYSFNPHIDINKIIINGAHIIDEEDINNNVLNNLSGKYIYLFSKNNSFIYPEKKIYDDLIKKFPRIETLKISRSGLNTLNIDISEKNGSYLYCGAKVPEILNDIGENCYYLNNDGFVFDKSPYFSGNVFFKFYVDTGEDNPLGKNIIPTDYFHQLVRFIDGLKAIGFNSIYLVINTYGTNSLYLNHGPADTSPEIIFKSDANLDELLDNLTLSMDKKEFADEIKGKYTKLLYIDLRFDNKVLYKFQ